MFDKFKDLLGGGAAEPPDGSDRPAAGKGGARRPARPRTSRARGGDTAPRVRQPTAPFDPAAGAPAAAAAPTPAPREIPCPSCGEPMLAGWGTTCGRCRPNLVAPKTLYMAQGQLASPSQAMPASEGMTLGWLVVVSSIDGKRRGALIELDQPRSILSRADSMPAGTLGIVEFVDTFMSSGHAVLSRPRTGNRNDAFTIRDRETEPSANGTFVNSRRLPPGDSVRLADGDVIKVGATELLFRSLWLPAVAARAS